MILVLDNHDSFTYNFVRLLEDAGARHVHLARNDALGLEEVQALKPDAVVISPGPGRPAQAGISLEVVSAVAGRCPLLGICLGHQCIVEAFGGRIQPARRLMHGKISRVLHDGTGLLTGLPSPLRAARYHSLAADPERLPPELRVVARAEDGEIMGVEHRIFPIWGLQFHPESFLTESGLLLAANFLHHVTHRMSPRAREASSVPSALGC